MKITKREAELIYDTSESEIEYYSDQAMDMSACGGNCHLKTVEVWKCLRKKMKSHLKKLKV